MSDHSSDAVSEWTGLVDVQRTPGIELFTPPQCSVTSKCQCARFLDMELRVSCL